MEDLAIIFEPEEKTNVPAAEQRPAAEAAAPTSADAMRASAERAYAFLDKVSANEALTSAFDKEAKNKQLSLERFCQLCEAHGFTFDDELRQALLRMKTPLQRMWYEKAWNVRLEKVLDYIEAGFSQGPLALTKLKRFEEMHGYQGALNRGEYFEKQFHEQEEKHGRLPTGKPPFTLLAVGENYQLVPRYTDAAPFIADYIEHNNLAGIPIVELGCGTGRNLMDIHAQGLPKDTRYFAGDWSPSALKMVSAVSHCMEGMQVTPFRCDFTALDCSAFATDKPILIFTYHAIEQVHMLPDDFYDTLAAACPNAIGIHMEPFGFQLTQSRGTVSDNHAKFMRMNSWNHNLMQTVSNAQKRGILEVTQMYKNIMGGDPLNPTSVVMWRMGGVA